MREARYFIAVAEELHFGRAAERLQLAMVACGIGVAVVPESSAEYAVGPGGRVRFARFHGAATIELAALWLERTSNLAALEFVSAGSMR